MHYSGYRISGANREQAWGAADVGRAGNSLLIPPSRQQEPRERLQ